MIRYATSVVIHRPPEAVFEALLDPATYARWMDGVEIRFDAPGPPTVGTTGVVRVAAGAISGTYPLKVVQLEPNRRLALRIDGPGLTWLSRLVLADAGDDTAPATLVDYEAQITLEGFRRFLEPMVSGQVQAQGAGQVERLRALLESAEPTA